MRRALALVTMVGSVALAAPADAASKKTITGKVKVPDSKVYEIEVSHRGGLTYTKKDRTKRKWRVAFTLG